MKKTIKTFAIGLLSVALFSCQDAALPAIDNMVYISDAAEGRIGSVTVAKEDTEILFSVRLAQPATEDVKVSIVVDPTILEQYNNDTQSEFLHVDAQYLEVPALAVIPAGSVASDPIKITVKKFEMFAQYALSFKISSNGSVPVAKASSQYIFKLLNPLVQIVPKFNRSCAMQCVPTEEAWGYELMNYTLEWWVKMSKLNINNQAIINSGGEGCELYIRFGDLIYSGSTGYDNRFLQIKTMGGQFDTGDPTKGYNLEENKWYHFAITYDGTTGENVLYQNGVAVNTLNTGAGRAMKIDRFQMCSSNSYFPNEAEMCQVRLWRTTRSAVQVAKNMSAEVDPSSPDLVMYLPMNEGFGATMLNDVTGNGHNCYIGNLTDAGGNGVGTEALTWTEYTF